MHQKNVITAGEQLNTDSKVLILLHGRGGSAEDILSLANYLDVKEFTLMAPQATNHTWYPYSFSVTVAFMFFKMLEVAYTLSTGTWGSGLLVPMNTGVPAKSPL